MPTYVWPNSRAAGRPFDAENPTCPARADCYDSLIAALERALFTGFSGGDAASDRGTIAKMGKRANVSYRLTFRRFRLTPAKEPAEDRQIMAENIVRTIP